MTSYSWKGSLAKFSSALVKIGSLSFTTNTEKRIKSWSSKPNGAIDSNTLNDTTISRKSMGIKGTFTIGGVSPDYANFRDAAFAMNNFGVCGSVVFNVRNGYYNESISLDSIAGASSSNTVIFQSASLDPAGVNLDTTWSVTGAYPGGSTGLLGHTIQLYGATYITFQYLTISNFGAGNNGFANVVELTKRASHNTFDHDILLADTNTTAADYGAVIYNDPASSENFNTFSNSLISGNKYGFYFYDYYPAVETGNIIHGNTILNSKCGINAWYQDSLIIEHNKIFLYLNTFSAINLYYIAQNGTGGDSSLVANNMITTFNSDTSSLYIYDYNARINVYNNSIYSSPNSSNNFTVYALNYYAGLGGIVRLMNNVVENDNSGPVLFSAYSNNYSDYNDWYSTGSLLTSWDGTLCADLSTLQSTSGMDAHSINADPVYNDISTGNLHATTSSTNIDGKGTPLNCIKDDIDGQSRNKTTPDMGADEFNTFKDDIGVSAISIPGNICGSKNTIRAVKLHNYGINDQTKFNISVDAIKGAKGSAKLAFTGTLKADSDAIVNISFSPALDTRAGGSFTFKAYTDLTADKDRTNDTTVSILSFKTSPVANFSITNGCPGDTAKLSDASAAGAGTLSSYTWDFGSGNKSTGSKTTFVFSKGKANIVYAVTNSSGCSDTLRKTITIAHPDSSFLLNISADGTVTFSANNTSLAKYTWDFGDKSASGNGNPVIHKYKIGRYTASLIATDSNGCSSNDTSSFSILTSGIGVQEQFENFSLSIYPNPFSESANIHYSLASDVNVKISIYDFTGKLIAKLKDQRENAGEHIIRFSPSESASINAGTYLVRIIIGNQVLNKTITFVR